MRRGALWWRLEACNLAQRSRHRSAPQPRDSAPRRAFRPVRGLWPPARMGLGTLANKRIDAYGGEPRSFDRSDSADARAPPRTPPRLPLPRRGCAYHLSRPNEPEALEGRQSQPRGRSRGEERGAFIELMQDLGVARSSCPTCRAARSLPHWTRTSTRRGRAGRALPTWTRVPTPLRLVHP